MEKLGNESTLRAYPVGDAGDGPPWHPLDALLEVWTLDYMEYNEPQKRTAALLDALMLAYAHECRDPGLLARLVSYYRAKHGDKNAILEAINVAEFIVQTDDAPE